MDPYENPQLSIDRRVDDLMSQMSLEEKVGQLQMTMGWSYYDRVGDEITISEKFKQDFKERQLGSIWALMRADPWTQRDFSNGVDAPHAYDLTRQLQQYVRENSQLGIPLLFAEECPHGLMALDATVYPTALGRASSFNVDLERKIANTVEYEARSRGAHIAFGPVVDISRDPRWSRMEESYGEDPVLTAKMSTQYALGLQDSGLIATMKHFTAYGVPEGGHNGASAHVGRRELLSTLSYPFKMAIQQGLRSVMTSYNDVDGVPCSGNVWLMQDILRDSWQFKGLVISDLFAINGLVSARMASDYSEAAVQAVKAGVNIDLGASCYGQPLVEAVEKGLVTENDIDSLLRPVLVAKFELGLFDEDFTSSHFWGSQQSSLALQAARESVVMLKNEHHLLPLSRDTRKIALIGPNADNMYNMLGDYTAPQRPEDVVTVLEGLRQIAPQAEITYVKGCAIRDTGWSEIDRAVAAVQNADVAIVVLGGSSARDFNTTYQETGAAEVGAPTVSDMECGEGFDRASLDFLGLQDSLLKAVCASGKPIVLVLIQGRPLNLSWAEPQVDAILNAWYPGCQGGQAIAEILFGEVNPSGHLPVSYPQNVNQLPVYYNTTSPRHDYTDQKAQPLYPFGFGLSYTTFSYTQASSSQQPDGVHVSFTLTNTGTCDGAEVVQLYLKDNLSSVMLPEYQLKQFQKIDLKKGESKAVEFVLTEEDFSLLNQKLQWVVEPGSFTVRIGSFYGDNQLELGIEP